MLRGFSVIRLAAARQHTVSGCAAAYGYQLHGQRRKQGGGGKTGHAPLKARKTSFYDLFSKLAKLGPYRKIVDQIHKVFRFLIIIV